MGEELTSKLTKEDVFDWIDNCMVHDMRLGMNVNDDIKHLKKMIDKL